MIRYLSLLIVGCSMETSVVFQKIATTCEIRSQSFPVIFIIITRVVALAGCSNNLFELRWN